MFENGKAILPTVRGLYNQSMSLKTSIIIKKISLQNYSECTNPLSNLKEMSSTARLVVKNKKRRCIVEASCLIL